jgi:hypothetical protein
MHIYRVANSGIGFGSYSAADYSLWFLGHTGFDGAIPHSLKGVAGPECVGGTARFSPKLHYPRTVIPLLKEHTAEGTGVP